jgi:hypothetical protein
MVGTKTRERKREGQRKAKRRITCKNQEKEGELAPLVVGNYFTHNPSNVTCMQIVRSNNNGRSKTNIIFNTIFFFIIDVKGHKKSILIYCLKN